MLIRRGFQPGRDTKRGCAVAIGNFDGLHLGHQKILALLQERSRDAQLPAIVLSFEPHPREFLAPTEAPARLMRLRDKARWLAQAGIDELRLLHFDDEISGWSGAEFIERVIVGALGARRVVVGEGFRFGHRRSGDVALLRHAGAERGIAVDEVAPLIQDGSAVSSTRVREALAAGRLDQAKTLLGRDYRISGRVIPGERLGLRLGFPTANIRLHRRVPPLAGIFAVRASGPRLRGHPAVAAVGTRPTVGGTEWLLEVHLFDFDGDLYRARLDVDFIARLRDEIRYLDLESMTAQMHDDARRARELLDA
ncbi:MAG: bifunctional riboflavin kinase/FAD synthetase [Steroidobacteraceae bacterium]